MASSRAISAAVDWRASSSRSWFRMTWRRAGLSIGRKTLVKDRDPVFVWHSGKAARILTRYSARLSTASRMARKNHLNQLQGGRRQDLPHRHYPGRPRQVGKE